MILEIDVTVTGPDQVLTGSVAVTVNVPAAGSAPAPATQAPASLAELRERQREQALRQAAWSGR